MPAYPWLFSEKDEKEVLKEDVVVPVPAEFLKHPSRKVVASSRVLQLVAYLQSLKQAELPGSINYPFIPAKQRKSKQAEDGKSSAPDGQTLYLNTCAACHQPDGKGLAGAFPALAGSPIVNDENPETLIKIILQGYDARPEFGVMASFADVLSDEEIAAIASHERSSWGNQGKPVSAEEVKRIRSFINNLTQ